MAKLHRLADGETVVDLMKEFHKTALDVIAKVSQSSCTLRIRSVIIIQGPMGWNPPFQDKRCKVEVLCCLKFGTFEAEILFYI